MSRFEKDLLRGLAMQFRRLTRLPFVVTELLAQKGVYFSYTRIARTLALGVALLAPQSAAAYDLYKESTCSPGAKWDTVYGKPAHASLPLDRLAAAVDVLTRIEAGGRAALDPLNAASLAFRRAAR